MPAPISTDGAPADGVVSDPAELAALCAALDSEQLIAIDTEFLRTTQFAARLCIAQIATDSGVWCVDELAGLDTQPLWRLLGAGRGLRVLHAAKQDLEVIWQKHGVFPAPLFDTQIAAGFLGHPAQVGYAGLVKALLGIEIDKTHTRADWSARPLRPELVAYAAADVAHLPEIHELLATALNGMGRYDWVIEDSARLLDPTLYALRADDAWQRVPAIPKLPVPAQLRARRLARWREEFAQRSDRPRQWILSDRALLDIAMRNPRDAEQLAACDDVAPGFARRQSAAVLAELAAADAEFAAGVTLPRDGRPEPVDPDALRNLSRIVEQVGKDLGMAPEILATRRDMTGILRGERQLRPLSGWRKDVIGDRLLAAAS